MSCSASCWKPWIWTSSSRGTGAVQLRERGRGAGQAVQAEEHLQNRSGPAFGHERDIPAPDFRRAAQPLAQPAYLPLLRAGATLDETQELLKLSGLAQLYPRIKRDAIIIYGLAHGEDLFEINDRLFSEDEETLF